MTGSPRRRDATRAEPRRGWGRRRIALLSAAAITIVAIVVALVIVQRVRTASDNLAGRAEITASSTALGSAAEAVADGTGSVARQDLGSEWVSATETVGASVSLAWGSSRTLERIVLEQSSDDGLLVDAGFLSFGDGSSIAVAFAGERTLDLAITPRDVDSLTFTVSEVPEGSGGVGLAEIRAFSSAEAGPADVAADAIGDLAGSATATSDGADASALTDGADPVDASTGTTDPIALGEDWIAGGSPALLRWAAPVELASVQFFGASSGDAGIPSGDLRFDDGSSIRVGGIPADPALPTLVAFMPRITSSIEFEPDAPPDDDSDENADENADGNAGDSTGLAELRAFALGATPLPGATGPAEPAASATFPTGCAADSADDAPRGRITVRCPSSTSSVDGPTEVSVFAPGMQRVEAQIWSPDRSDAPALVATRAGSDDRFDLEFDADEAQSGPITVRLQGFEQDEPGSSPSDSAITHLQLFNLGGRPAPQPEVPQTARGMTLAFAEEFTGPLSISRDGAGTAYTAAKPEPWGPSGFGDAEFADPSLGYDTVSVVGDDYLRLSAAPLPSDYAGDDTDKDYLGGILSSARPGGSGFSAQYGYFEARMLAPIGEGTWPAFWTLPSPNLIEKDDVGAEVDVIELYGHDPVNACVATHAYADGEEEKNIQCADRFDGIRSAMAWHTYGARVTPTEIVYYIDGREVDRAPQVRAGDRPMFFMVNLALGGGWPIDLADVGDRAALYVDYVRVYT
ncbi:MAG: hypothetical protein RI885_253 [Actinomycetota bacterium]